MEMVIREGKTDDMVGEEVKLRRKIFERKRRIQYTSENV